MPCTQYESVTKSKQVTIGPFPKKFISFKLNTFWVQFQHLGKIHANVQFISRGVSLFTEVLDGGRRVPLQILQPLNAVLLFFLLNNCNVVRSNRDCFKNASLKKEKLYCKQILVFLIRNQF